MRGERGGDASSPRDRRRSARRPRRPVRRRRGAPDAPGALAALAATVWSATAWSSSLAAADSGRWRWSALYDGQYAADEERPARAGPLLQVLDGFVACGGNVDAVAPVLLRAAGELAAPAAVWSWNPDAVAAAFVGLDVGTDDRVVDAVAQMDWECFLLGPDRTSGFLALVDAVLAAGGVPAPYVPALEGLPAVLGNFFGTPGCTAEKVLAFVDAVLRAQATGRLDLADVALGPLFGVVGTTGSGETFGLSSRPVSLLTCVGVDNLNVLLEVASVIP